MRLRSELTSAVFAKALKRREASGIKEKKENEGGEREEDGESASVGKVVSMVSEDVNRVLRMVCLLPFSPSPSPLPFVEFVVRSPARC
jgi:hypothetical protein